jgi:hypothetical protein
LHINPYKQVEEIILVESQKNYQINLKNLAGRILKVKTKIKQIDINIENKGSDKALEFKENDVIKEGKGIDATEPTIICTFKDIDEYLLPDASTDLNINFICFEVPKKIVAVTYELSIYVK